MNIKSSYRRESTNLAVNIPVHKEVKKNQFRKSKLSSSNSRAYSATQL